MIEELKTIERETRDMIASLRGIADHLEGLAGRLKGLAEKSATDTGAVVEIASAVAEMRGRLEKLETPQAAVKE